MDLILTRSQLEAVRFVFAYRAANGYAPTLRELTRGIGLQSTNGGAEVIDRVIQKGLATKAHMVARSLCLTPQGEALARGEISCAVREVTRPLGVRSPSESPAA